jgi:hypothetical protein
MEYKVPSCFTLKGESTHESFLVDPAAKTYPSFSAPGGEISVYFGFSLIEPSPIC